MLTFPTANLEANIKSINVLVLIKMKKKKKEIPSCQNSFKSNRKIVEIAWQNQFP